MSGRWTGIRDNIVAAIAALPGINGTPVVKVGIPSDAFFLGYRDVIGVGLAEDVWDAEARGIADYRDNAAQIVVPIVILCTSESSPESVLDGSGLIDDLTDAILGSNAGTAIGLGIRGVDVGTPETGPVYLQAEKSQLVPDQSRAKGSGGALAKILEMKTTVLPL